MRTFQLPDVVRNLWQAQQALQAHYGSTMLKFTLDGRLVGDIAEAIALQTFSLALPDKRTGGVDAIARDGRTVQIKSSGLAGKGPAFSAGKGIADHLIFLAFDFGANSFAVVYNGPEAPIRKMLPPSWGGTKRVDLRKIALADRDVPPHERLQFRPASLKAISVKAVGRGA
jgi:hypothetical protein